MGKTRKLGPWQVSAVGLGLMNVSWPHRAATDPQLRVSSAIAGIHAGLDAGCTFLDTADIYAPSFDQVGHNEIFVREALETWSGSAAGKEGVRIATKGGITRSEGEVWGRNASLDYLISAAEASRERLGVEQIDLWQHHRLDPSLSFEQQFENVLELKVRGIVKHVGVSNYDAAQVKKALEIGGGPEEGGIISVQNEFSPFYRHDLDVLNICEQEGLAFLPWSPLGGSKKVARLREDETSVFWVMAREKNVSVERLVIAMLLAYSPVIIPIPGATRTETITDVLAASELVLSAAELAYLVDSLGEQDPVSEELTPKPPWR
jgi:aryl-alcohol dehydrogenase-like predicted oxidoreductase